MVRVPGVTGCANRGREGNYPEKQVEERKKAGGERRREKARRVNVVP